MRVHCENTGGGMYAAHQSVILPYDSVVVRRAVLFAWNLKDEIHRDSISLIREAYGVMSGKGAESRRARMNLRGFEKKNLFGG